MQRTLNKDLPNEIGKTVSISGWVDVRRDHGKLIFLDIRDRSGIVQVVVTPKAAEALDIAKELRAQWVVAVEGEVKARPEAKKREGPLGGIEISAQSITVLSRAQELPFELGTEVNLDTHLDHLPLTLRSRRSRDIFKMQASILNAYRTSLRAQDFTEFEAPVLVGGDAEGGAAAFKVGYYYDQTAYLATSPQFYKEIMVNAFERSFCIAKIFRGEKHATPRHLSELTQMDFEMGFIKDHRDVMKILHDVIVDVVKEVAERHADILKYFSAEIPQAPEEFPTFTLAEAQEI